MKEYKNIKTHYKKEQQERLKKEVLQVRNNWECLISSPYYRDLLTKRQKAKSTTEQKKIIIEKLKAETIKRINAFNIKCDEIIKAENVKEIYINVSWVRSRTWGYNPHVELWANGYYTGSASGCGYDKLSAACAVALNENKSTLKIIYNLYEKALQKDKKATPHTVAYGMGYSYPYYEGGVGYSCFHSIFKLAGAKINEHRSTNTSDIMIIKF